MISKHYVATVRREVNTDKIWLIAMENTKPISDHIDLNTSGLCLPRRSRRAEFDSSNLEDTASRVCSFLDASGVVGRVNVF